MQNSDVPTRSAWTGRRRAEMLIAVAAFAVLCVRTLSLEPDDAHQLDADPGPLR